MIQRADRALQQMRREHAAISVAEVGRCAGVSRTFLYQNAGARALIAAAVGQHTDVRASAASRNASQAPAIPAGSLTARSLTWKPSSLNAWECQARAHALLPVAAIAGRAGGDARPLRPCIVRISAGNDAYPEL
jgi:hypothetical protein